MAPAGGGGDPAGARLLDVRVLLPVHPRRAREARRLDARGGASARRRALGDAPPGDAAAAPPLARRGGVARVHERRRLVQRPVRVRRRISRDDDADRRHQAQRRAAPRHGRDRGARAGGGPGIRVAPTHRGRRHPHGARQGDGTAPPADSPGRRPHLRHDGRLGLRGRAPAAAPDARARLARSLRHLDHRDPAAGAFARELSAAVQRGGAAAPAREFGVDGGREHLRGGRAGARRRRARREAAAVAVPRPDRSPPRAALGPPRNGVRPRAPDDVQHARPTHPPLGARGDDGAAAARLLRAQPPGDRARRPGRVPPARPGARRGGGESRRRALGHVPPGDAAAPHAGARRRREPRVRRGARRLCHVHRPLYTRQSTDLDRDHVEPPRVGAGGGGGVWRDPDGAERGGPRRGSETMKRLSVLMAVCFVDMLGLMLVAPLMAFYALRLRAPEWMVGPLIASFAVAQLVSSPVWGRVSDRYGRRPALIIGLAGSAFAYLIFGFANTLWLLFASRIVQGLGGGTTGVAQAYVADTMAPAERAKALGWLSAATSAGVVIGPIIGSVAHRFGTEVPGVVAAALVLINVYFAWKWLPESNVSNGRTTTPSGRSASPTESRSVRQALWEIMRHPATPAHRVIWIYVVGMLALNVVIGVLALYLKDTYAVTEDTIGYFFPVFGIVGVLMRVWLVGWFNDRFGEVRTMQIGTVLLGLGLVLMPLPAALTPGAPGIALFIVFLILVPVGTALLFPASTSLVSQRTAKHELGLVMGAQQTFRGIMSIVGPVGATLAFDGLGHGVPFLLAAAIVAVAGLLAFRAGREAPVGATAWPPFRPALNASAGRGRAAPPSP